MRTKTIAAACGALLLIVPGWAAGQAKPASPPDPTIGPTVGHVGTSTALLWVRAPGVQRATVAVDGGASRQVALRVLGRGFARIPIAGLTPDTAHRLVVTLADGPATTLQFRTAPLPRAWGKVKFGVGSCVKYNTQPVWDTLPSLGLDLFLWLGDNIYYRKRKAGGADWDRLDWMLERQLKGRNRPNLLRAMQQMACYGIWDDHDYGPNNSDGSFPLRAESRLVHRYLWANPSFGEEEEGIYFRFRRGPVEFFLLDDRFFKRVKRGTPKLQRTLYGKRQLAWLRRGVAQSDAPLKVIAGGVQQVLGYPGAEGWDQARAERKRFMAWLQRDGSRVLFLSGDIHLSELYQVPVGNGRTVWELTSSGLANKTRFGNVFKSLARPERKWIEIEPNVCTVELEIKTSAPVNTGALTFRCLGVDGTLRHETKTTLGSFEGTTKTKPRKRAF